MVMVCMCVLIDGDRVETGCGSVNEFMDCTGYFVVANQIKFIAHIRL